MSSLVTQNGELSRDSCPELSRSAGDLSRGIFSHQSDVILGALWGAWSPTNFPHPIGALTKLVVWNRAKKNMEILTPAPWSQPPVFLDMPWRDESEALSSFEERGGAFCAKQLLQMDGKKFDGLDAMFKVKMDKKKMSHAKRKHLERNKSRDEPLRLWPAESESEKIVMLALSFIITKVLEYDSFIITVLIIWRDQWYCARTPPPCKKKPFVLGILANRGGAGVGDSEDWHFISFFCKTIFFLGGGVHARKKTSKKKTLRFEGFV